MGERWSAFALQGYGVMWKVGRWEGSKVGRWEGGKVELWSGGVVELWSCGVVEWWSGNPYR